MARSDRHDHGERQIVPREFPVERFMRDAKLNGLPTSLIIDKSGQEVARVGVFGHGADDGPILTEHHRGAWDLARRISLRLGHMPAAALESTA